MVECLNGKPDKRLDPLFQGLKGDAERRHFLRFRALHSCRIIDAPVRPDGLSIPDRAGLLGRISTDRNDEVYVRRARLREFIPAFASEPRSVYLERMQERKGRGVYSPGGMTARAVTCESLSTLGPQNGFGQDAAGGVSRAKE